jgi:hypothetical protein
MAGLAPSTFGHGCHGTWPDTHSFSPPLLPSFVGKCNLGGLYVVSDGVQDKKDEVEAIVNIFQFNEISSTHDKTATGQSSPL